jgi:hypothetical protein
MNNNIDLYDWRNRWINLPLDWWKNWSNMFWVPHHGGFITVNPIFKEVPPIIKKYYCSVIIPFGKKQDNAGVMIDFDLIYDNCIKPSLENTGFTVEKANQLFTQDESASSLSTS